MPKGIPVPLNHEFHKWFYSVTSRQCYDEKSACYKVAKLAWEERTRMLQGKAVGWVIGGKDERPV